MAADVDTAEAEVSEAADDGEAADGADDPTSAKLPRTPAQLAIALGMLAITALTALVGWLGFAAYQSHRTQEQRALFVQVARQGALNLTTIDWQHADADVQRILSSATGRYHDDLVKRQQPFIEVVKKAQSKSEGTIVRAGLESATDDEAQVLVTASVKTSNLAAAEQHPRTWRMRISVQRTGGEAKIADVEFVP